MQTGVVLRMVLDEHRTAEHVAGDMRKRIQEGQWQPEQMLPGRRALATEYGVALATLERAVAVLMAEGLLRADSRRGTFVASDESATREAAGPSAARLSRSPLIATVAVVAGVAADLPDDEIPWPLHILRACEDHLGSVPGMTMRFVNTKAHGNLRPCAAVLQEIQQTKPDGIVSIDSVRLQDSLTAAMPDVPVVNALFDPDDSVACQVTVDEPNGGLQAARHLLLQGYRRLLYFQPFASAWVVSRLEGVRAAAGRAGLLVVSLDVQPEEQVPQPEDYARQRSLAYAAARTLMRGGLEAGLGVIAPNDGAAVGFLRAAKERGLEAGADYGLIGFDDYERCEDISTMRPPLEQMGAEAARLMERVLRGEAGPSRVLVHHRLIPRGSTRRRVG